MFEPIWGGCLSQQLDLVGRDLGRYRVTAFLGRGGVASVWKAEDTSLGGVVALKVLDGDAVDDPSSLIRLRHEAEVASLLDHPAIVPVHQYGNWGGYACIAMGFVEGRTIEQSLRDGLAPVEESLRIAKGLAGALGFAHARGVLHRDLSARNVMIGADGRVYLLDFGLALVAGFTRVTRTGTALGTGAFMAPELLAGEEANAGTDFYSLAVITYLLLTGNLPHKTDRGEAILYEKLHRPPTPVASLRPECGTRFEAFFARGLSPRAEARFTEAEDFISAIDGFEPKAVESGLGSAVVESASRGTGTLHVGVPAFHVPVSAEASVPGLAAQLAGALRQRLPRLGQLVVVKCIEPLGPDDDARAWANAHGAQLVLIGRLRAQGRRLRVDCTLVDPTSGASLAGDCVEGSADDVFGLEDRLVSSVRDLFPVLRTVSGGVEREPIPAAAAGDRFEQARRYLQRHDHEPSVDQAISLLERLSEADPENGDVLAVLGRAYLAKQHLTKQHVWEHRAADAVDRARRSGTSSAELLVTIADLRALGDKPESALEAYRSALSAAPEHFEGWLGLARLQVRLGEFELARQTCARAIALRPYDWRGFSTLGLSFFRNGLYERALQPWRKVMKLSPDNLRGALNLAAVHFELAQYEKACSAYRRAIEITPSAQGYSYLGASLAAMGRDREALEAMRRATLLNPADPMMWGNLGLHLRRVGMDEQDARAALERAAGLMREHLKVEASDAVGWAWLGSWLLDLDDPSGASMSEARALSLQPLEPHVLTLAAQVHARLGEPETALDLLERAVARGARLERYARHRDLEALATHPRFLRLVGKKSKGPHAKGSRGTAGPDPSDR